MPRPQGRADPRDPSAPTLTEDPWDSRRSEVTVGELVAGQPESRVGRDLPAEPLDTETVIRELGPERWAELQRRFVLILAALRERRGFIWEDDDGG